MNIFQRLSNIGKRPDLGPKGSWATPEPRPQGGGMNPLHEIGKRVGQQLAQRNQNRQGFFQKLMQPQPVMQGSFEREPRVFGDVAGTQTPTPTPATVPQATPVPTPQATPQPNPLETYFGLGSPEQQNYVKQAINKAVWDSIMKYFEDEYERAVAFGLTTQESSGGVPSHLENEEGETSYGPYQIYAGVRGNPWTGQPFTKEEASDIDLSTKYLKHQFDTRGIEETLSSWNPRRVITEEDLYNPDVTREDIGAQFYPTAIPRFARRARFYPVQY